MSDVENTAGKTASYETFEDFLATTDDTIKELYKNHTSGLSSALEKERSNRKDLEKQMKDLLLKAEKGSVLEKELAEKVKLLEEADKKYTEAERRAKFVEEASREKCTNAKAAYALAVIENLFSEDGSVKWKDLKNLAPELFKFSGTDAGSVGRQALDSDINAALRQAALGR